MVYLSTIMFNVVSTLSKRHWNYEVLEILDVFTQFKKELLEVNTPHTPKEGRKRQEESRAKDTTEAIARHW